jgi:hypothetical protein
MEETFGLQISNAYRYCYTYQAPSYIVAEEGEMYEDIDGEDYGSYYGSSYAYAYDWFYDDTTTVALAYMGDWNYSYDYPDTGWTGPAYFAWYKSDNGSHALYDEAMPTMLDTSVLLTRTQLWFETAGFVLPAESWTEEGDCIIDDILPTPDAGPGFSWGGGVGVEQGDPNEKRVRLLAVQDYYSDYYGNWPLIIDAFEELGLEEDEDAGDDMYVVFNNYSSTYTQYFITEDMLADFNAIYWFNSTYYYGTLWGADAERTLVQDWVEGEQGRFFAWNGYHYSPRYFGYNSSYPQYDPTFMEETFGLLISNGYRYCYTYNAPSDIVAEPGEMYESLDGEDYGSYYNSSYAYAYDWFYDDETTVALAYMGTWNYSYDYPDTGWTGPAYFAWCKSDNGSYTLYDEAMPNMLDYDVLLLRTQEWFTWAGFTLP